MKCSLIADYLVNENKSGNLASVSETWDLAGLEDFTEIATHAHIAPAVFRENKRDGIHFISTDFLSFDFDDGIQTAERVHAQLSGRIFNHALLASKNHLKDKGDGRGIIQRFHAFIPLSEPIHDRLLYKFAVKKIAKLLGWKTDQACSDSTRYFYRHRETLFLKEDLKPMDTEWIRALKRLDEKLEAASRIVPVTQHRVNGGSPLRIFQRTKAWRTLTDEMSGDGQRYANSMAIIGVMKRCGLTLDDAIALFDQYATYGNSFNRQSIERMFRQFG